MKYKYIILDFGKVIASPSTGNWDMTPKFQKLIDMNNFDVDKFKNLRKEYGDILSEKLTTLGEEYDMFYRFYYSILSKMDISDDVIKEIARNRTYEFDKYSLYDNVFNELKSLKEKYHLIMLTDNWPCVLEYLKEYNLGEFFEKVYVSSFYGVEKKEKEFFNYPIREFNIKPGEAIFIDDNESNLDVALTCGLDVKLMDRELQVKESKYEIIHNLENL